MKKQRFIPVYFKNHFYPFIQTTTRSQGTNAIFKENLGSTNSVIAFMTEYDRISQSIEEKRKENDSVTRRTSPTMWSDWALEK